jgi:hypothetical protein
MRRSDDLIGRFGGRSVSFSAVLVIGRDQHLQPGELDRLIWRRANVIVASRRIECVTLDELARDFEVRLATFLDADKAGG